MVLLLIIDIILIFIKYSLAKKKGYNVFYWIFAGNILGLIILLLLPSLNKEELKNKNFIENLGNGIGFILTVFSIFMLIGLIGSLNH